MVGHHVPVPIRPGQTGKAITTDSLYRKTVQEQRQPTPSIGTIVMYDLDLWPQFLTRYEREILIMGSISTTILLIITAVGMAIAAWKRSKTVLSTADRGEILTLFLVRFRHILGGFWMCSDNHHHRRHQLAAAALIAATFPTLMVTPTTTPLASAREPTEFVVILFVGVLGFALGRITGRFS